MNFRLSSGIWLCFIVVLCHCVCGTVHTQLVKNVISTEKDSCKDKISLILFFFFFVIHPHFKVKLSSDVAWSNC